MEHLADPYPRVLRNHLLEMRGWCDHDGDYQEPTHDEPYDHCDGIFCVRCGIEFALYLLRQTDQT